MHQIQDELRSKYTELFDLMYEKFDNLTVSDSQDAVYTNSERLITVILSPVQTVPEWAFLCLVRGGGPLGQQALHEYFVSKEYNVSDSLNTHIAGRFVFQYSDEHPKTLHLYALTEVPATTLSIPGINVEREYLERRKNNEPGQISFQNVSR